MSPLFDRLDLFRFLGEGVAIVALRDACPGENVQESSATLSIPKDFDV